MSSATVMHEPTIGILYPGELGSSLGKELINGGKHVVTTVKGRSARTRALCREAKLCELDTFGDVVNASDIIISLVHPGSAQNVAERFANHMVGVTGTKIYVDLNSVSPETAVRIGRIVRARGSNFCDATIQGPANRLSELATLYVSGEAASEIESVFAGVLRIRTLGDTGGRASAMKMVMAGLTKGLTGLFLELSLLAQQTELSGDFLDECDHSYPAVMEVLRRILPTVPQHAGRRAEEMAELVDLECIAGVNNGFATVARSVFLDLAASDLKTRWQSAPQHSRGFQDLVNMISYELEKTNKSRANFALDAP